MKKILIAFVLFLFTTSCHADTPQSEMERWELALQNFYRASKVELEIDKQMLKAQGVDPDRTYNLNTEKGKREYRNDMTKVLIYFFKKAQND